MDGDMHINAFVDLVCTSMAAKEANSAAFDALKAASDATDAAHAAYTASSTVHDRLEHVLTYFVAPASGSLTAPVAPAPVAPVPAPVSPVAPVPAPLSPVSPVPAPVSRVATVPAPVSRVAPVVATAARRPRPKFMLGPYASRILKPKLGDKWKNKKD